MLPWPAQPSWSLRLDAQCAYRLLAGCLFFPIGVAFLQPLILGHWYIGSNLGVRVDNTLTCLYLLIPVPIAFITYFFNDHYWKLRFSIWMTLALFCASCSIMFGCWKSGQTVPHPEFDLVPIATEAKGEGHCVTQYHSPTGVIYVVEERSLCPGLKLCRELGTLTDGPDDESKSR